MARTTIKASKLKELSIEFRQIGGRVLQPGTYVFNQDPDCRYDERQISGTERTYMILEVQTMDGKWVDVSALTRKTETGKNTGLLTYVNEWVMQYSTIADLAEGLAGKALVVTTAVVDTFTTYKGGELLDKPVVNGKAYKAMLLPAPADGETPADAPAASEAVSEAPKTTTTSKKS